VSGARLAVAGLVIAASWATAVALTVDEKDSGAGDRTALRPAVTPDRGTAPVRVNALAVRAATGQTPVGLALRRPPKAGLLFDVGSGRVLWQLHPHRRLPIASLTKMMTALLIAQRHRATERVRITRQSLSYSGSGIGVLPLGKRVRLGALLDGLLLVSGNDAAIALAQHDAGGQDAFIARMNRDARRFGLRCSRFSSPSGIRDEGNHSCPLDLATLARMDLGSPWLRRIVGSRRIRLAFPVKGGVLDLFNINPFIAEGLPGITGVKTGLTNAAGRCYVITARRGGHELGVVLLNSPNPLSQVPRLLRAGARAVQRG
jgi:D-alanyl-D-alanine carboxypeptidase